MQEGIINQIIGPVIDIKFEEGHMPELLNAIMIQDGDKKIMAEVAQHIGDDVVRCVALSSTDGLVRGMKAADAIARLEGIDCRGKGTSCPDQLARALRQAL